MDESQWKKVRGFLDPTTIGGDLTPLDIKIITVNLKSAFEGIDTSNEEELLFNLILKKCIELSDRVDLNIPGVLSELKTLLTSLHAQSQDHTIFRVFYSLLSLFLKENWTGPSFLSHDVTKKLKKEKKTKSQIIHHKKYPEYDFTAIIEKFKIDPTTIPADINTFNYKYIKTPMFLQRFDAVLINELEVDGESWPRLMPLTHLYIILRAIINFLFETTPANPINVLYKARMSFIHSQLLYIPTGTLYPLVVDNYQKFFTMLKEKSFKLPRNVLSNLYVENSHAFLFFYKYSASKKSLTIAQELLNIEFSLTGRMGKRTKYQTFNTCQLVVQAFQKDEQVDDSDPSSKAPVKVSEEDLKIMAAEDSDKVDALKLINEMQLNIAPQNISLDEECILLEKPLIDDSDEFNTVAEQSLMKDEKSQLNLPEQILVLGLMKHQDIANPHDDIYHEYIQAYCNLLIDRSLNWMVFSTSLFYRSINEYIRYKKMERALLQMQTLVDQYHDPMPSTEERQRYLFSLNYPHYFDLQKNLAEKYMKVGIVMSGCQIFEKLGMFEECVECLQQAGHSDRAKKLAEQYLPNATPKLLCTYGELTRDIKYFKQAWKQSNKRFARAQRSLGKAYFYSGLLQKSVKAFRKAVDINRYNTAPWFTMGCAYIRLEDLKNAAICFSTVVSINESDGEAWANLSSCLLKQGKKTEALSTLEQAAKFCERNWRIQENLMFVSLANQKFFKYFDCIERLISLNHKDSIDEECINKIVQVFKFQMSKYFSASFKHQFVTYRNRIERLFDKLQIEMGEKHYVWKGWAEFKLVEIDFEEFQTAYLVEVRENFAKLEDKEGQSIKSYFGEDPNSSIEDLQLAFKQLKRKLLIRIADLRLKTCQVLQIVGWHHEPRNCELLFENMILLIEASKVVQGEQRMKELDMFIKSAKSLIEQCLEKTVDLSI